MQPHQNRPVPQPQPPVLEAINWERVIYVLAALMVLGLLVLPWYLAYFRAILRLVP